VIQIMDWHVIVEVAVEPTSSSAVLSARVDSFEVREGHGGLKPLTQHDRSEIKKTIGEILDSVHHPVIEFASAKMRGNAGELVVEGQLTIRGATQPVTVRGRLDESGERLRVSGRAVVTQSEWGIKPYTAFLGALKLRDDVEVEFEADMAPTPQAQV
jgi:polyisoprenoid-binding protein YceI